ncbi:YtpR family tRNA-binding protein [Thalassobacillus hwangdonensis]|uniref:YtpR family tRNA-binding protein n=1 Tax=Thalassobacillus hwangdonensis TaxID=546108 RepID=A0ABW3KYX7_9BACI
MHVFYNTKGIGDVLLMPLKDGDRNDIKETRYGDIVKITSKKDGSLLGYNLFNFSHYVDMNEQGKVRLTEELLEEIRTIFKKNELNDALDFDLTPKFVVGYVEEKAAHENADKLNVCTVDVGSETLQIVCGAPNVDAGQKVVVAKVGAVMPGGMKIKPTKLRGVPSNGMICSAKELGLPDAPKEKGILVLEDSYDIGQVFDF